MDREAANWETAAVDVRSVVKRFGVDPQHAVTALRGVSLTIQDNEFFTLLGPSGCGKTTLLRLIAGFEQPTEGEILLFGEHIEGLEPHQRPVNTVFQHYSLFPHMNVSENIAFGLKRLKRPKTEVTDIVRRMLQLVKLESYAERRPSQLSGGQQQRVALARALAPAPKVLLLDEPLSALDLKLRQAMRAELKQLQQETGITFIFVTHDQQEALTMSDRIAVMSEGEIQQIGSASDIYERPVNHFVADFIGDTNFLDVTVESITNGRALCRGPDGFPFDCEIVGEPHEGQTVSLSIRPEKVRLVSPGGGDGTFGCHIERLVYFGTDTHYQVVLSDGTQMNVRVQNAHEASVPFAEGDRAALRFDDNAAMILVD